METLCSFLLLPMGLLCFIERIDVFFDHGLTSLLRTMQLHAIHVQLCQVLYMHKIKFKKTYITNFKLLECTF